jgi:O-glycosyl hydrolase
MKKHYIVAIFFVLALNAGAQTYGPYRQYAQIDFDNGTSEDSLGNAVALLQNGAQIVADPDRDGSLVAKFDASTKGNLSFNNDPLNDSITIAFWFKREAEDTNELWRMFFAFYADDGSNVYFTPKTPWFGETSMIFDNKLFSLYHALPGGHLDNNVWAHHAVVFAGNSVKIYQNGQLENSFEMLPRLSDFRTNQWYFGNNPNLNYPMSGRLDDLKIFHSALAGNQIQAIFDDEIIPEPEGVFHDPGQPGSMISVSVDLDETRQTIRHFGASDGWNTQFAGLYFNEKHKEEIAELLFSKEKGADGSPRGIGLSAWRFNIGAGTTEQGDASRISVVERRTEGFLNGDGTYDWSKQAGQRWFLEKAALTYQVPDIIGWQNSPPIPFTKRGLGFREYGDPMETILRADKYDDFGNFLADVVLHFAGQGIHFKYISPLNEPQFGWAPSEPGGTITQEGTPWTNKEISDVVHAIDNAFEQKNVDARIFVTEAAAISYLLGGTGVAHNQLNELWEAGSPLFLGDLNSLANVVAAHSYWHDDSPSNLVSNRIALDTRLNNLVLQPEYWQTEYCLLGNGYRFGHPEGDLSPMRSAISLARVIHTDITVGQATGWSWWTAMEFEKYLGKEERYSLFRLALDQSNTYGAYKPTKLLYALGHYSHFVRPGMKRLELERSDNMTAVSSITDLMISAYLDEENDQVVLVAINASGESKELQLKVNTGCKNLLVQSWNPYLSSDRLDDNLRSYPEFDADSQFVIPALSMVTFTGNLVSETAISENLSATSGLSIFPNPTKGFLSISYDGPETPQMLRIFDLNGREILAREMNANKDKISIDLSSLAGGTYLVYIITDSGVSAQKLVVYP